MAKRFYVVPAVSSGLGRVPKYLFGQTPPVAFSSMDYGLENTFLVGVEVTDLQHTLLASQGDVIVIPADLDGNIGLGAISAVQSALESLHVPADWVTTSHTYRDVVRNVGKLFLYMQRFHARELRKFFEGSITLSTRVNQLTQSQRQAMTNAAVDIGLSTTEITNTMTLRMALKILADQMPSFTLFGETF